MDVAYLTALSALGGSVVGGLITGAATWLSQRAQARAGLQTLEFTRRQDLFRDFIAAAAKAYGEGLLSNEPHIDEIVNLYALLSRMRILCLPRTIESADAVLRLTVETVFAPGKTMAELHEMIREDTRIDPLKKFAEAARVELESLKS